MIRFPDRDPTGVCSSNRIGLDIEKTQPDQMWKSKPRWSLQSNV